MNELHGQLWVTRRAGEEFVLLTDAGVEFTRFKIVGGRARIALTLGKGVRCVRAELINTWKPRPSDSKWDLLQLEESAELAAETVAGFLAAVDRGELPRPAKRWKQDGRGGWRGDPRWRRGELMAAVANRALHRQTKMRELATPATG